MGGTHPLSYSQQGGLLGQRGDTGPKDSPLGPGSCHRGTCGLGDTLSLHFCQLTPVFLAIFKGEA